MSVLPDEILQLIMGMAMSSLPLDPVWNAVMVQTWPVLQGRCRPKKLLFVVKPNKGSLLRYYPTAQQMAIVDKMVECVANGTYHHIFVLPRRGTLGRMRGLLLGLYTLSKLVTLEATIEYRGTCNRTTWEARNHFIRVLPLNVRFIGDNEVRQRRKARGGYRSPDICINDFELFDHDDEPDALINFSLKWEALSDDEDDDPPPMLIDQ